MDQPGESVGMDQRVLSQDLAGVSAGLERWITDLLQVGSVGFKGLGYCCRWVEANVWKFCTAVTAAAWCRRIARAR